MKMRTIEVERLMAAIETCVVCARVYPPLTCTLAVSGDGGCLMVCPRCNPDPM